MKGIKRIAQKTVAGCLTAVLAVGLVVTSGCGGVGEQSSSGDQAVSTEAVVWTATGLEKIKRDDDYSDRYQEKALTIKTFKNEHESSQIIISLPAGAKAQSYTLTVNSLKASDGTVLDKEHISVYNQKYINVEVYKEVAPNGAGYYPDAILPFDKAVEYGENVVQPAQNQGIWVMTKVPSDQKAGVYTGSFDLKVGDESYAVPVEVTVYDYALTDEAHLKTWYGVSSKSLQLTELDYSDEMWGYYQEFFFEHRISKGFNQYDDLWGARDDEYFDYVEQLLDDPRCNTYRMMFTGGSNKVEIYTDPESNYEYLAIDDKRGLPGNTTATIYSVEWNSFQKFLVDGYIKESLARGRNLFEKATLYASVIDEYDAGGQASGLYKATYTLRRLEDTFRVGAKYVENLLWENGVAKSKYEVKFDDANDNGGYGYYLSEIADPANYVVYEIDEMTEAEFEAFKVELIEGILGVRNGTTATEIVDFIYENQSFGQFCPTIDRYDAAANRDRFAAYAEKAGAELWTYTAVNPTYPYPTHHIEDNLISSRLLGWMMYEYNISGLLYWATNLCEYTEGQDAELNTQDFYQDPLRFLGSNGDGFLYYPGRDYGIDGPVSSIRMEALTDCAEDYDLLFELEEVYKKRGFDGEYFEKVIPFLTKNLYNGTKCLYGENYKENFFASRDMLADLLTLAYNTDTVIKDYTATTTSADFVVSAPAGATVTVNGSVPASVQTVGEYKEYSVHVDFNQAKNLFALKVENGGKTEEITVDLGAQASEVAMEKYQNALTVRTNADHANEKEISGVDGVSIVKLAMTAKGTEALRIDWTTSELKLSKEHYSKLSFKLYYSGTQGGTLKITASASTVGFAEVVTPVTLRQGWNEIEIDLSSSSITMNNIRMSFTPETSFDDDFFVGVGEVVLKGN